MENENIIILYRLILCLAICMITITGSFLNIIAIATNGGRMPVKTDEIIDSFSHFNYMNKEEINNAFLADNYEIMYGHLSIGDILIYLSILFQVYNIINLLRCIKFT